ncbi:MAG TPA: hypothetical protein VHS81_12600 [Caulobacteraceae bacterium]|jgi:hypothetical protein|nr:hypothetical protein [Caulobacteraceae bacterium]
MESTQTLKTKALALAPAAAPTAPANLARPAIGLVSPPPAGLRARQLFQEARRASLDHVGALQDAVASVLQLLDDVVEGGEVYTPGLSAFAARLGEDLFWKSKSLATLANAHRLQVDGTSKQV